MGLPRHPAAESARYFPLRAALLCRLDRLSHPSPFGNSFSKKLIANIFKLSVDLLTYKLQSQLSDHDKPLRIFDELPNGARARRPERRFVQGISRRLAPSFSPDLRILELY
ncbi:hypothetical protein EVAR_30683_1 [Eumeta japonica]|uniref:Uncharacterized protein n=1 Tax=Eumeta variegata TaxID=151549 RepID=A0A4C1VTV3_EUMVA|nr:hypothetical protein EVAR_30683_1 [Eumeta japonica]